VRRFASLPSTRRPAATPSQPDPPSRSPQGGGIHDPGGQAPAKTPTPAPVPVTVPPAPATPAPTPAVEATVTAAATPALPPQAPVAVTASVTVGSVTVAVVSVGGRIGPAIAIPSYTPQAHDADDGACATHPLTSLAAPGKHGDGRGDEH
jgi:hypothetical protein